MKATGDLDSKLRSFTWVDWSKIYFGDRVLGYIKAGRSLNLLTRIGPCLIKALELPFEETPKYINSEDPFLRSVARYRLEVGR